MSSLSLPQAPAVTVPVPGPKPTLTGILLVISRRFRAVLHLKLGALDLQPGQDEFLVAMDEGIPRSISSVAQVLNVRTSTVLKLAERLVASGFLIRHPSRSDQRTVFVSITPSGLSMRAKVVALYEDLETDFVRHLRSSEVADLVDCLSVTDGALRQILTSMR
jgi:DNA-binding MarR family transcriptional regulator